MTVYMPGDGLDSLRTHFGRELTFLRLGFAIEKASVARINASFTLRLGESVYHLPQEIRNQVRMRKPALSTMLIG